MNGKTLGHYRVGEQLGRGGMGEVYLADDLNLNRKVALKFLPNAFAVDPERMARFEREAKLLASLNHPNIAAIYGLEQAEGKRFIVLELVKGETLAQKISKGALPVDEALAICRQIAEGLEAAHEKGVIHRDLKPANVMIAEGDRVKILDFGLAKALEGESAIADAAESPTLSLAATKAGIILGTAAYMAPEQARGSTVDKRCDIWSFGVVLFEMLTGKQLFSSETVSDTLAAVLRSDIDWNLLPANTPASIRALLRRCLNKDRKERLRDIGEARIAIADNIADPYGAAALGSASVAPRNKLGERLAWGIAIVCLVGALILAALYLRQDSIEAPVMRTQVVTPPSSDPASFAISPDGRSLVFMVSEDGHPWLWVRSLDEIETRRLAGTEGAKHPFWSPDSRYIGFFADRKLKRLDMAGGPPQVIADAPNARGGTWSKDDLIVFAPEYEAPLFSVPAHKVAKPVPVTRLDRGSQLGHIFPQFMPDGRHLLYYAWGDTPGIYFASLESPEVKRLPITPEMPASYAPPGYLLFMRQRTLFAQSFDAKRGELSGDPVPVADSVESDDSLFLGGFSTSRTGILAYRAAAPILRRLAWFDRSGKEVENLGSYEMYIWDPELSPDGTHLAINRNFPGENADIWLIDTALGGLTRFTSDPAPEGRPIWSPDGSRILFSSSQKSRAGDLRIKALNGTGKDEQFLFEARQAKWALDWSKDGQYILYMQLEEGTNGMDLWALPLSGDRKPIPVANTSSNEGVGKFSPDVRWVAYESNESGRYEIYLQPFPGPGRRRAVSANGGITPRWNRDGRELFFISPENKLMVSSIRSVGQDLEIGAPAALFATQIVRGGTEVWSKQEYDLSPDGKRFLINLDESPISPITIVTKWTRGLKK